MIASYPPGHPKAVPNCPLCGLRATLCRDGFLCMRPHCLWSASADPAVCLGLGYTERPRPALTAGTRGRKRAGWRPLSMAVRVFLAAVALLAVACGPDEP